MIRYEDIQEKVESYLPEVDYDLLRRAYVFSAMEHKGQVRQSGEPYLIHPLSVADILAGLKLDVTSVAVGLLHDVLEDTLTTREVLDAYFGKEIADLVEALSKISRIHYSSKEQQQADNFRRMMLAMTGDIRVIFVKLADRLHNMRTLEYLTPEQQMRISRETIEIYAPLAHRLGIGKIRTELEDLSLRYVDPEGYKNLMKQLERKRKISEEFIKEIQDSICTKLAAQRIEAEIHGRVKHLYSIYNKMKRQGVDVEQVYDYVAFRVLAPTVQDCYAALGIIHSEWRPVPGRIKDFIAMPKPNMYQSLHTSVITDKGQLFEVQIRTPDMHRIAEDGIAAHWKYKEGRSASDSDDSNVQWLRQLLEWQQEQRDPREFLKLVKVDLYPQEVYAFTPKGDVKSLPRGATPIDFAYAIHTEVGNRCVGARINGKLVPLRTPLTNGDIIEILTSPGQHPKRDWLNLTVTSRARSKIRHFLSVAERRHSVDLGRSLLEKELRRCRARFSQVLQSPAMAKYLTSSGHGTPEDLFAAIGYGKVVASQVVQKVIPQPTAETPRKSGLGGVVRRALGLAGGGPAVKVKGLDDLMVVLARCCKPVRGETIVGYITRGKGVSVHAERCPNVEKLLLSPERRIEVSWDRAGEEQYEVQVHVHSEDRKGILAKITSVIASEGLNIKNIEARARDDHSGQMDFWVEVHEIAQLRRLLDKLRKVPGVRGAERMTR
ncbi:MAG: bifunctional (p)ppGpp synthetase/guanosine-3',5'-bis(diphosphate) 3'-pyrophosphohydrolase [Acidobacteria bacterium]|nr:bifunctional (p)ppGpp synthetase/guanosine-3',5'-bis(diphosphate) 3'-pyrophosphohydrolase [Acidobacteriota bacterium]